MAPSLSNSADDKQPIWSKQKEEPHAPGWVTLQNNRAGHTDRQDLDTREWDFLSDCLRHHNRGRVEAGVPQSVLQL